MNAATAAATTLVTATMSSGVRERGTWTSAVSPRRSGAWARMRSVTSTEASGYSSGCEPETA